MSVNYGQVNWGILLNGAFASFGVYFCMYAFRKPFSVATFEDIQFIGINFKILLILVQVLGYMVSKFIGINVISGLKSNRRALYLVSMIVLAELTLIFFGLIPSPYNFIFFFFNGLSLGMIWGIVFSYLEGRKMTEILSIILCSSFIVSSGAVKSVGLLLMSKFGISQFWMPAATGGLFLVPFFISLYFLQRLPAPTAEDLRLRKKRRPMGPEDRKKVLLEFLIPITILVVFYIALTALRDFRDNFSRELWESIGYGENVEIYTFSEIPVAILVLLMLGLFGFIKSNYKAFIGFHYMMILASFLIGLATILFQSELLHPLLWMVCSGFGLYACYVPFNSIFFDRMIATFRIEGNAGYLIYIADSFGYLGSMAVLLYKNFGLANRSWLQFYTDAIYSIAVLGILVSTISMIYFQRKYRRIKPNVELELAGANV